MSRISTLNFYLHTIRYLKFKQIVFRVLKLIKRKTIETLNGYEFSVGAGCWIEPIRKPQKMFGPKTFNFLNNVKTLETFACDDKNLSLLWRYNFHYFDDLTAVDFDKRSDWHENYVKRWILENGSNRKSVGWDPYPTSLRIVNWIKWGLSHNHLDIRVVDSIASQAHYLAKNVEWHLMGNHVFANAKALIFAGVFLNGERSNYWFEKGVEIISSQLDEQILPDGGHFERSPMYHSIILEDLADLINLSQSVPEVFEGKRGTVKVWREKASLMRAWLSVMMHPDGKIAFFNDSAFGVAADPKAIFSYCDFLKIYSGEVNHDLIFLEESGYLRVQSLNFVLIVDVGELGPDYQLGHAHADTLSFELSLYDKRVIVNSGISTYEICDRRQYERSSRSHNTLEIEGKSSSEMWASFRVARRAYPHNLSIIRKGDTITIEGSHTGFRWLNGAPLHTRSWAVSPNKIVLRDQVDRGCGGIVSFLHFHPDIKLLKSSSLSGGYEIKSFNNFKFKLYKCRHKVRRQKWASGFGRLRDHSTIEITPVKEKSVVEFSW